MLPNGSTASGKTLFLRSLRLMIDPRAENESLVERLPRDEKDRRVSIYHSYFPCFDNESYLSDELMDELCAWVTGISMTVRELYTTFAANLQLKEQLALPVLIFQSLTPTH